MVPKDRLDVFLTIVDSDVASTNDDDEDVEDVTRRAKLEAHGEKWATRLQQLIDEGYVDDWLLD